MIPKSQVLRRGQEGFSLLEVLISVLIFSIGLLALVGMQGLVVGNTMDAEYRVQAGYLTNRLIGQMWVDLANLATYDNVDTVPPDGHFMEAWVADVAAALPGASGANAPTVDFDPEGTGVRRVDIIIRWQRPSDNEIRSLTTTSLINGPT